jgi:hypothetical protein
MAVAESWEAIMTWLQTNAELTASLFLPAEVGDGDLDGLPADAAAWFSIQGGANRDPRATVLMQFVPLSLAESRLAVNTDALEDLLDEVPAPLDLIPIADMLAGPLLVIDNRPGPDQGSIKQLDWEDTNTLDEPLWTDLEHLLRDVGRSLVDGTPAGRFGLVPNVVGGYLDWLSTWKPQRPVHHEPAPSPPVPGAPWTWASLSAQVDARPGQDDEQRLVIIGTALDRLLALEPAELALATRDEPPEVFSVDLNVLLAACVEYAYAVREMRPPDWVRGRYRFMEPAWKLVGFPSAHIRGLPATPAAFVEHGITIVQ